MVGSGNLESMFIVSTTGWSHTEAWSTAVNSLNQMISETNLIGFVPASVSQISPSDQRRTVFTGNSPETKILAILYLKCQLDYLA